MKRVGLGNENSIRTIQLSMLISIIEIEKRFQGYTAHTVKLSKIIKVNRMVTTCNSTGNIKQESGTGKVQSMRRGDQNTYTILVRKPEWKRLLGKTRYKGENNIQLGVKEMEYEFMKFSTLSYFSLLGSNVFLSTLFQEPHNVCCSTKV